jgi:hypothetical protein
VIHRGLLEHTNASMKSAASIFTAKGTYSFESGVSHKGLTKDSGSLENGTVSLCERVTK